MSPPRVSADTDDRDGAASDTDKSVDVLDDDAQEAKKGGDGLATSGFDAVAALYRSSVALAGRGVSAPRCRRGDRKGSESDASDDVELELHIGEELGLLSVWGCLGGVPPKSGRVFIRFSDAQSSVVLLNFGCWLLRDAA